MMKMSVGRWPEIRRPLFEPFGRFVGQPSQQFCEWSDIALGIAAVLAVDFFPGEDLGNLRPDEVVRVFQTLSAWLL